MTSNDGQTGDESEPTAKKSRYLQTANLVVRLVKNVVKLATMLLP